jgi:hypothetical protein
MNFQTTGQGKVSSVSCCLLFDPMDGRICHVHRIITMEGAPVTAQAALESRTLQLAKELGLDTGRLRILHVAEEALTEAAQYTVDPVSSTLVKRKIAAIPQP